MITLKMNAYTDKDKTILLESLDCAISMVKTEYCKHLCTICPAQRACIDMCATAAYLRTICQGREQTNT